jgi:hypothetical protein
VALKPAFTFASRTLRLDRLQRSLYRGTALVERGSHGNLGIGFDERDSGWWNDFDLGPRR